MGVAARLGCSPVSTYTTEQLIAVQGVDQRHIQLLPPAYNLPSTTATASGDDPPGAAPCLLSVARLDSVADRKGIDLVIQCLPHLIQRYPSLRYEVIGCGADLPRLQALAADVGVSRHVFFRGFVPDVDLRNAYAACDVFVLPGGKEGFGIVYLEAMAEGKPVVAARAGGVPDVVLDGETGLLVPYGDVNALSVSLLLLLDDRQLRARLGAAGRDRVRTRFSLERFMRDLEQILTLSNGGPAC